LGHGGLKLPFLGSKTAFLRSEIADFEAILAFKTPFFTNKDPLGYIPQRGKKQRIRKGVQQKWYIPFS